MNAHSFAITHSGTVRKNNEDYHLILNSPPFCCIADGMGGHNAGEIASREACLHFSHGVEILFSLWKDIVPSPEVIAEKLSLLAMNTNEWLLYLGEIAAEHNGMGTTFTGALIHEGHLILTHVGDSRLFRLRKSLLEQLSEDQTAIKKKTKNGITYDKRVLTQAMGSYGCVTPQSLVIPIEKGDLFLITSDGVTDCLSIGELKSTLSTSNSLEEKGVACIELALTKKARDNITLILMQPL